MEQRRQPSDFNTLYGRAVPILIGVIGMLMCRSTLGTTLSLLVLAFGFTWFWVEVQRILERRGSELPALRLLPSVGARSSLTPKLRPR